MFVIDIIGLAGINQLYGNKFGDEVLKRIAIILKGVLFRRDVIGRVGGDKFTVFAKGVAKGDVINLVEKLISALSEPVVIDGKSVSVSVSIGASTYPEDARTAQGLLEKAYIALSFARRKGENAYRFFSSQINNLVREHMRARAEVRRALEEDRFIPYLQPYYETRTGRIAGFGVLMRMKDSRGKILTPKDFTYTLERTGLIREAELKILSKLKDTVSRVDNVSFSFNLSPKSFKDEGFLESVKAVAGEMGRSLILEITESPKVLAIVELARRMGLKTVAKGVETEEQLRKLKELNCTYVQGFYLAKPMPVEEALKLLV